MASSDQGGRGPALRRETIQRFSCPRCGAWPGENCIRVNGEPRTSNHRQRIDKARRLIGATLREERGDPEPPDYLDGAQ
jgi:hypothetical protein